MHEDNFLLKEIEFSGLEITYNNQLKLHESISICCSISGISITSEEINSFIVKLKELERRFYEFESIARTLNNQGKPKLLSELTRILNDIKYQIMKFDNQYQDKLREEQRKKDQIVQVKQLKSDIGNSVKNPWTEAIRESMKIQQASNDRLNKIFTSNLTETCPNCHRSLGNNFYILEICPFCRLALHM